MQVRFMNVMAISLLFMILLIIHPSGVRADDCNMGRTAEGVFPMSDTDVVMVSEDITVQVEKGEVECIFLFENTGSAKKVTMGFPGKLEPVNELSLGENLSLHDFKTYIDGKSVPVKREKGIQPTGKEMSDSHYSEWFTFTVPFEANEKKVVRNTYKVQFTYDSIGDVFAGYILETGAYWKDPIGYARVTFDMGQIKPYQIQSLRPGRFTFKGSRLIWERSNFEPAYNLEVMYNTWHYSKEFLDTLDPDSLKRVQQQIQLFEDIDTYIKSNDQESLAKQYGAAIEGRNVVLAQYIHSYLPRGTVEDMKPVIRGIDVRPYDTNYVVECFVDDPYMDLAHIQSNISHLENGREVVDYRFETSSCIVSLVPDIDYTIRFTIRDSVDREDSQSLLYKIPGIESDSSPVEAVEGSTGASVLETPKPADSVPRAGHGLVIVLLILAMTGTFVFLHVRSRTKNQGR
jgi:hypothetical protein